jgi:pyruvate, water dikinase
VIDTQERRAPSFSLNDDDVTALAHMAVIIEKHYGRAMDIEWGQGRRKRQAVYTAGAP